MAKEYPRTRRVAEQLVRELSEVIRDEVKDPRLGPVTVTDVEVSRDLRYAKVFVSFLGQREGRMEKLAVLTHAAGFIRHELGERVVMKVIPRLRFEYDESLDEAERLDRLIDAARAEDADKAGHGH
ncbi:MAG TPA: 30S ribosome-binding factor RbfA [Gammaproteobacteria bacterium]|nr:30S ribosome-binding factor RbfA [Gammaproteobacteria bacterium]